MAARRRRAGCDRPTTAAAAAVAADPIASLPPSLPSSLQYKNDFRTRQVAHDDGAADDKRSDDGDNIDRRTDGRTDGRGKEDPDGQTPNAATVAASSAASAFVAAAEDGHAKKVDNKNSEKCHFPTDAEGRKER